MTGCFIHNLLQNLNDPSPQRSELGHLLERFLNLMAIQEKSAATTINPGRMPSDQIISEFTKTKAVVPPAARAKLDSSASAREHKARKPYTITKQREKWTEEEHMKFLEALKLYGRAWRKIEEHIGTKTTVQIRSHAQKFFSKITREPRNANFDSGEAIEIPPPRPKRKPTHPYPRKFVGRVVASVMPSSSSPLAFKFEQEKGSPTSVLSATGSDTIDSTISGPKKNGHISSDLSAAGSSSLSIGSSSDLSTADLSTAGSPSPRLGKGCAKRLGVSLCSCPIDEYDLELDSADKDKNVSMEGSSLTSLKLFGSTFVVAHPQKDASKFDGNPLLFQKASTLTLFEELGHEKQEKQRSQPTLETKQTMLQADLLLNANHHDDNEETVRHTHNVQNLSKELDSVLHPTLSPQCFHYPLANMVSSFCKVTKIAPNICGNVPCKMVLCKGELSKGGCNSSDVEMVDALEKGDDLDSESVESPVYKEKTAVSPWKVSVNSAFSKPMKLGPARRGFLPYKRCKVEGGDQPSQSGNEIRRQSTKFCL